MTELGEVFATAPALLAGCVFVLSLLVGSFLNVVIHRLPLMLDREWQAQARELLAEPAPAPAASPTPSQSGATIDATADSLEVETAEAYVHSFDVEPAAATSSTFDLEPTDAIRTSPGVTATAAPAPVREAAYNLLVPRSRCPHCNAEIKAHQNIPVLSYLLLGGRCATCSTPISLRYPVVELTTAVLSAAVALHFGWHWQTLAALLLTWALIALAVIDLDHTLLPDVITLPLLWIGLLLSLAWHPALLPPTPVDARSAIAGAVAGYVTLWSVFWVFKLVTGKDGMGYGDFKLLAALGAWLGWQMLPLVLLLSTFVGASVGLALVLVRRRDRNIPMPFGPYLAAAGWVALMWGPQIVGSYVDFTGLGD